MSISQNGERLLQWGDWIRGFSIYFNNMLLVAACSFWMAYSISFRCASSVGQLMPTSSDDCLSVSVPCTSLSLEFRSRFRISVPFSVELSNVIPILDVDCQLDHGTLSSVTYLSGCIGRVSGTLDLAWLLIDSMTI
jgi:hypothetical protein